MIGGRLPYAIVLRADIRILETRREDMRGSKPHIGGQFFRNLLTKKTHRVP
jgi:hypothetical protein